MRSRRRKIAGDLALPPLPDTTARLICFTVLTCTRGGRTKTAQIRLLTTLLDPGLYPAGQIAALYQKRWLIEVAFLHLKRTVRGAGRVLRGRSAALARQEAWALLLAHNMIAALAARAAATAWPGPRPGHLHRRAVPRPRRRHRRHLLPPLPQAPCQRKRPDRRTRRRDPRPPARPRRPPAHLRPHRRRTTEMDQRTSRLHPHHRPVKSPENRRKSRKLRAVPFTLAATFHRRGRQ